MQATKIQPQIDQAHEDDQQHEGFYHHEQEIRKPAKKSGHLKPPEIKGQDSQPLKKIKQAADQEHIHPGHLHDLMRYQ